MAGRSWLLTSGPSDKKAPPRIMPSGVCVKVKTFMLFTLV